MALIKTQSPDGAEIEIRAMYARQQSKYGYVPNYAKAFCYRPDMMGLWSDLQAGIRKHLAPREYELATFGAAHALKNSACALAHGHALTKYFSEDDVIGMAENLDACQIDEADKALIRFARKVALDASAITAGDINDLRHQGFNDAQIFDIASAAAARCFFAKLLDAVGVEPDHACFEMSEKFRQAMVVGRPISAERDERLIDNSVED